MKYACLNDFLNTVKYLCIKNKIYIWGVCVYGTLLGKLFNHHGIQWNGYYDNFNEIENGYINGRPVYKGSEVKKEENVYFVLSMRDYEPVKRQLLEKGMDLEHILYFENITILDEIEDIIDISFVNQDKIKSFQNIHNGDKCFIIGNGPSLCVKDLNKIYQSGLVSLACNLIFKCYDITQWRPKYYFFTDGVKNKKTFTDNNLLKYVSENCEYIFSRSNGDLAKYNSEIDNLILFKYMFSDSEDVYDFSSDCSQKIVIGHTVTYAMLQMAVYMGFKTIYLLGIDHNFSREQKEDGTIIKKENIKDHSSILGNYSIWGVPDIMNVTKAYISAKRYADEHDIKIYNTTRGGKLEVFERLEFDKVLVKAN